MTNREPPRDRRGRWKSRRAARAPWIVTALGGIVLGVIATLIHFADFWLGAIGYFFLGFNMAEGLGLFSVPREVYGVLAFLTLIALGTWGIDWLARRREIAMRERAKRKREYEKAAREWVR